MTNIKNRIAGALYGVAVGDALGAPLEFMDTVRIARTHGRVTEMIGGGWLQVRPGEITDDTDMTLAVAEGIVEDPKDPIRAIGRRFIKWAQAGPKDIGGTCAMSIFGAANRGGQGGPGEWEWREASKQTCKANGNRSAGNGALMRTVYPGLYYGNSYTAMEWASRIAEMTHWDIRSTEACRVYTLAVHSMVRAGGDRDARLCMDMVFEGRGYGRVTRGALRPTGYVVDTFACALHSIYTTGSFEDAVVEAANLGGDADTIAAIAGGLAGALYGYDAIPERWVRSLAPWIRAKLDTLTMAAVTSREQAHKEKNMPVAK